MSTLDDELEAAADRIASRGAEGRRDAEVKDLTAAPAGAAVRVVKVALAVVVVVAVLHAAGVALGVHALRGLCSAVGICG